MTTVLQGQWRRDPAGKLWRVDGLGEGEGLCAGPRAILATPSGFGFLDASTETVASWPVEPVFAVAVLVGVYDVKGSDGVLSRYAAMRSPKRSEKICLLGGKVEPGELPEHAAAREVWEESGHGIVTTGLRRLGTWVDEDGHLTSCYLATGWSGELHSSPEGPAEWVTYEDLVGPESAYPGFCRKAFAAFEGGSR